MGVPILATELVNSRLTTKLSVFSCQATLASGVKTTSRSGHAQTMNVVSARIVDGKK